MKESSRNMMKDRETVFLDPAGNITAVVRMPVERKDRPAFAKKIMDEGLAEQVGFEMPPIAGGECRLEMMGGEFCGNAARSFAFYHEWLRYNRNVNEKPEGAGDTVESEKMVLTEISGCANPVPVLVNLAKGTAFARMPVPESLEKILFERKKVPLIHMEGIDHLILFGRNPEKDVADRALALIRKWGAPACGIMFLEESAEKEKEFPKSERESAVKSERESEESENTMDPADSVAEGAMRSLTPAVFVEATDSFVWESSCGSGSVACAWFLASMKLKEEPEKYLNSEIREAFKEPGGEIEVRIVIRNGQICECLMGGSVNICALS